MTMISKQEQWRKRIDECTSRGLSIQEWCKANAVSSDQYHYWKRKFNKLDNGTQKPETQWAPLLIEKPQKPAVSVSAPAITLQVVLLKLMLPKVLINKHLQISFKY